MDVVFLDANVLFSAAWRADAKTARLWDEAGAALVTSAYAVTEALRNLGDPAQRERLKGLIERLRVVPDDPDAPEIPEERELPADDRPILRAALGCGGTHLLTGNSRDFGRWHGRRVRGVLVLPPGRYSGGGRHPAAGPSRP